MELSQIQALAERVRDALNEGLNEANTKTSLVMPFLNAMGYDVFNHNEVALEYTSEWGTKKGEKVDIAILKDGQPIMLIECKALGDPLDTGKCSQLFRYFSTLPARIGILTNGQRYLFFSDIEKENIMDAMPYMEIDLLNFNERCLPDLKKLTKQSWDLDGVLSSAEILKFVFAIKPLIAQDFSEPTEPIVRYYAGQCYGGKLTSRIVEAFSPIVKRAFSEYISDLIAKRLDNARQAEEMPLQKVIPVDSPVEKTHNLPVEPETGKDGIVTHNTEVWALVAIRTLLRDVVSPSRIVMRDQKSYCSILLDDNNRKPICRLFNFDHFDWGMDNIGENAYILILTESNEKGERHNLQYVDDIYPLTEPLVKAVMRHEKGRESTE